MTTQTMREQFEQHMSQQGISVNYLGDGEYGLSARTDWERWQAAWNAALSECQQASKPVAFLVNNDAWGDGYTGELKFPHEMPDPSDGRHDVEIPLYSAPLPLPAPQPTMICKSCGADRLKEDCKGSRQNCSIKGVAQANQWLGTDEGKAALQKALAEAESAVEQLNKDRAIDPAKLHVPLDAALRNAQALPQQAAQQTEPDRYALDYAEQMFHCIKESTDIESARDYANQGSDVVRKRLPPYVPSAAQQTEPAELKEKIKAALAEFDEDLQQVVYEAWKLEIGDDRFRDTHEWMLAWDYFKAGWIAKTAAPSAAPVQAELEPTISAVMARFLSMHSTEGLTTEDILKMSTPSAAAPVQAEQQPGQCDGVLKPATSTLKVMHRQLHADVVRWLKAARAKGFDTVDDALTALSAAAPVAQDEREAFEAWYDKQFVRPGFAKHHRYQENSYCTHELSDRWKGWQARGALAPSQPSAQDQTAER